MPIENSMIVGAQGQGFRDSMTNNSQHDIYDEDMTWWYYKQKGVI